MKSANLQNRGVALILVLTTLAILTSIGVDFSYQSRVSLKLAENLRDETRAYYMARSAVNLSRLLLHFQKQVDQLGGQLTSGLTKMLAPQQTPAAGTKSQSSRPHPRHAGHGWPSMLRTYTPRSSGSGNSRRHS